MKTRLVSALALLLAAGCDPEPEAPKPKPETETETKAPGKVPAESQSPQAPELSPEPAAVAEAEPEAKNPYEAVTLESAKASFREEGIEIRKSVEVDKDSRGFYFGRTKDDQGVLMLYENTQSAEALARDGEFSTGVLAGPKRVFTVRHQDKAVRQQLLKVLLGSGAKEPS